MKNWLLNPSGLPNRFVEMDLVQEHLNLRVKVQIFVTIHRLKSLLQLINFYTGFLQGSRFQRLMGMARDHIALCRRTRRSSENFKRYSRG